MTFKYLYVFKDEIKQNIDFRNCDCPLDCIIIEKKLKEKKTWSKLDKVQYLELQDKIDDIVKSQPEYKNLGRLLYDFQNW